MTIARPPHVTFYGGEASPEGTAVTVEYIGDPILWDDGSSMLWDDNSPILWSRLVDTSPEKFFSFSPPRITYAGEAE